MDFLIQLLLSQEQKGCRRKSRRTNDLLFLYKRVMREVKMRKLSINGMDRLYDDLYDMVPHL